MLRPPRRGSSRARAAARRPPAARARARSRSPAGRGRARRSTARAAIRCSLQRRDERVRVVLRGGRGDRREAQRRSRPARTRRRRARASENSFSNAARSTSPRSASRASMRFRNERWQTGAGSPSRPAVVGQHRAACAARRAARGTCRGRASAGTRRPAPWPATGCSWSSPFIACIADGHADAALEPALQAVPARTPSRGSCRRCRTTGSARAAARPRRRGGRPPARVMPASSPTAAARDRSRPRSPRRCAPAGRTRPARGGAHPRSRTRTAAS